MFLQVTAANLNSDLDQQRKKTKNKIKKQSLVFCGFAVWLFLPPELVFQLYTLTTRAVLTLDYFCCLVDLKLPSFFPFYFLFNYASVQRGKRQNSIGQQNVVVSWRALKNGFFVCRFLVATVKPKVQSLVRFSLATVFSVIIRTLVYVTCLPCFSGKVKCMFVCVKQQKRVN